MASALGEAIDDLAPHVIYDLSDEPVLGYRERMEVAAVALARGVPYLGPDFRLDPAVVEGPLPVATVAVIGTGKRTGKTAVSGEAARVALAHGFGPVVVAMGRGGPPEPEVAGAGTVTVEALLELVRRGRHAASDYLEIAATSGVTTVGWGRAGGGLAGATGGHERASGRGDRRGAGCEDPDRRRERGVGSAVRLGRRGPGRSLDRTARVPGGLPGAVPAVAIGPCRCYDGAQPSRAAEHPHPQVPTSNG